MKDCIGLIGGHSGDSLTDELHKAGYSVALVGGKPGEPGMDKAEAVLIGDLSNHNSIIEFLYNHNVKFVVIGTGHILAIQLVRSLEKKGFLTNIDYAKSMLSKNKRKFKEQLIKNGIKTPQYYIVPKEYRIDTIVEKMGIPCVVKSTTDAVQPEKINHIDELSDSIKMVMETGTDVMIEQYVNGNDCTVAVTYNGDIIENLGVIYYSKAKEYKLKGFDTAYSKKIARNKEEEICKIANGIVSTLGFIGLSRIDFIIDQDNSDIYVLELNSVMITGYHGSAYPFFIKQGINIPKVLVENALQIYKRRSEYE